MKVDLTVYYTDGSSGIVTIEKPPGAHPDSIATLFEGVAEAERSGKEVSKIGRSKVNPFSAPPGPLVIDDNLVTRAEVFGQR
ncbi:MAG TPA: hypothetical protein VLG69_04035 [Candidatus Andersenbacteria bacterium]|nr:hypothetical protein [Candidatus Andersenbacteria bacterium]